MFLLLYLIIRWIRRRQPSRCAVQYRCAPSVLGFLLILATVTSAEPLMTNEKLFYVPFAVPKGAPETLPKLVELMVSGDRGVTWQAYQQRVPKEGRFSFQAGGDGSYFFATRTVNQNGQSTPERITSPELVVIVDRTQPSLQVTAVVNQDGQVSVAWQAADAHLAPETFSLRYRNAKAADNAAWQPADVRSNSTVNADGALQGRLTLWPPAGSRSLEILAETRDRAGNIATVQREIATDSELPNLARQGPALPLLADGSRPTPAIGPVPPQSPPAPQSNPTDTAAGNTVWKPENARFAPAPHRDAAKAWGTVAQSGPTGMTMQPQPPIASRSPTGRSPANTTSHSNQIGGGYPITSQPAIKEENRRLATESLRHSFGPSSDYRTSKSRRFHLDYDVESGADMDVFRVEVWFTDDGGRSWQHMGDDEDRVSPYLVSVPADGMYGFRLIVQSKEGLAARPPVNGDPADVWVRIDASAPTTRLTSAQFGRGSQLGTLKITWDVRDEDLSDHPVTLLYSGESNGPWRRIAAELPNTGRYDWRVDDRMPSRIYLRLEATDRAGNIGTDSLRDPIKSENLSPRGIIRGVRPASHTRRNL